MKITAGNSYLEASARQRLNGILDSGSFREFFSPPEKVISPHLKHFKIPVSFDDGAVVGEGTVNGRKVGVIAQEGKFMGGAFGEVHSSKIIGLLRRCIRKKPEAVVFLMDSGGVRLQEANAGEIGVSEIIRAVLDVRGSGIPVIGLVGGSCGCFGGAGIISGCCDILIGSEEGRVSVSGAEVIETTMGVEAFDSRDKALVWRTSGCKNRYILGVVAGLVENSIEDFRKALDAVISTKKKSDYGIASVMDELEALKERFKKYSNCTDGLEIWKKAGFKDPGQIPSLSAAELKELKSQLNGATE